MTEKGGPSSWRAGAPRLGTALGLSLAACSAGPRDAVPPTRDLVVDAGSSPRSAEGYEYVARRGLAVVALAEGRGLSAATSRAAVDHLADALDTCVTEQGRSGAPPRGAARVVVQIGDDGGVSNVSLRVDPGGSSAAIALLCLVAPVKLLTFGAADGAPRGLAIEALWGTPSAAPQP
jgi:hypothetical protein